MIPVGAPLGFAIFVIWWWVALFVTLPIGVRGLHETGEEAKGHDSGAPHKADLGKKALWATGLAALFWAATMIFIAFNPFRIAV